ncbi:MAG: hypothetical protein GY771_10425 [bacterium]|nr:hypothetical protein [bacterium]
MNRNKLIELTTPKGNDRLVAGFAHLATLINNLIILQIIFAVIFRERAFPAAAQSFQAAAYNFVLIAALTVIATVLSLVLLIPFGEALIVQDLNDPGAIFGMTEAMVYYTVALCVAIIAIAIPLVIPAVIGAIRCFIGKPFHYPIIGLPAMAWFYLKFGPKEEKEN